MTLKEGINLPVLGYIIRGIILMDHSRLSYRRDLLRSIFKKHSIDVKFTMKDLKEARKELK